MKSFLLFLALLVCAPMAHAGEVFLLFSHKAWRVHYATLDSGLPYCTASVTGDGVYFSIDVGYDYVEAWYINDNNDFGLYAVEGEVLVWIDHHTPWTTPAYGRNDIVRMRSLKKAFLWELSQGQRL